MQQVPTYLLQCCMFGQRFLFSTLQLSREGGYCVRRECGTGPRMSARTKPTIATYQNPRANFLNTLSSLPWLSLAFVNNKINIKSILYI